MGESKQSGPVGWLFRVLLSSQWAALQVLLSLGWDHSRQTAVIYIDKAVRGEVASRMVMDAGLGGRRGRERKGEERMQEMSKGQRQISDFWVSSLNNTEHTQ